MENINYFDLAIIILLLILGIKGMMSGLIRELFGLFGVGAGVYFASLYSGSLSEIVSNTILSGQSPVLIKLLSFTALLIVIWVVLVILGNIFSKLSMFSGLGFFDRLFGFIFGAGKLFLVFAVIIFSLSNIEIVKEKTKDFFKNSIAYELMYDIGKMVVNIDTKKLQEKIGDNFETNTEIKENN